MLLDLHTAHTKQPRWPFHPPAAGPGAAVDRTQPHCRCVRGPLADSPTRISRAARLDEGLLERNAQRKCRSTSRSGAAKRTLGAGPSNDRSSRTMNIACCVHRSATGRGVTHGYAGTLFSVIKGSCAV